MKKDITELDAIIEQRRKILSTLPPSSRPNKGIRPISSRTMTKAAALARAVYFSIIKAEKDEYIGRIPEGYCLTWTTGKEITAVASLADPLKQHVGVAAIIASELNKNGTQSVLIGDAAVEFYTIANYLSGSIDFVVTRLDDVEAVMTKLGFIKDRNLWYVPGYFLAISFVCDPSGVFWERLQRIYGPEDTTVAVPGIEDVILARVAPTADGNEVDEWVNYMMAGYFNSLEWDYIEQRAIALQCDEAVKLCKQWAADQFDIPNG